VEASSAFGRPVPATHARRSWGQVMPFKRYRPRVGTTFTTVRCLLCSRAPMRRRYLGTKSLGLSNFPEWRCTVHACTTPLRRVRQSRRDGRDHKTLASVGGGVFLWLVTRAAHWPAGPCSRTHETHFSEIFAKTATRVLSKQSETQTSFDFKPLAHHALRSHAQS
jgi:hypothetical protein